jgi:LPXTG-site transpeptidase (sortase) family protein
MPIFKKIFPIFVIFFGIFLMSIFAGYAWAKELSLQMDQQIVDSYAQQSPINRAAKPTHISIKWFVDVDIDDSVIHDGDWTISEKTASHLTESANPGEKGNIIIYGHNTRQILGNIRALTGKELIRVQTADGVEHHYKIISLQEVDDKQINFLKQTDEEILTLYTCSGFWDKQRFVVQAVPVE